MTTQIPDIFHFNENIWSGHTHPLCHYLITLPEPPEFYSPQSSNNRGYVASWKIENDRLYLIGLKGKLYDGTPKRLADVFPDRYPPLFADWYSGLLYLTRGEIVAYGVAVNRHEHHVTFEVLDGIVISSEITNYNKPPPGQPIPDLSGIP